MAKKKISDFYYLDDTQSQNYLASHWPDGLLTSKRFDSDSIIYKFIKSLAVFIQILTGQIFDLVRNIDIAKADELLTEWETSVKIPEIIPRRDTVDGRREAIERMMSRIPVYNIQGKREVNINTTIEEFVRRVTGIVIEVEMAYDRVSTSAFPLTFPVTLDYSEEEKVSIFIIKVQIEGAAQNNIFPMTFPVSFFVPGVPQEIQDLVDKALKRILPSYTIWEYEAITS